MDDSTKCNNTASWLHQRFELIGIILIAIGIFLTFVSQSAAGIVMIFISGIVLCSHGRWSHFLCHVHSHKSCAEECDNGSSTTTAAKPAKSAKKAE
jgi:uncharacterized membrane protein YphA (DoxX/SURF4 family)